MYPCVGSGAVKKSKWVQKSAPAIFSTNVHSTPVCSATGSTAPFTAETLTETLTEITTAQESSGSPRCAIIATSECGYTMVH
jgi:hypothetical protein